MKRFVATMPVAIVLALVSASLPAVAQTPVASKKAPAKAYIPARTPWGGDGVAETNSMPLTSAWPAQSNL